MRAIDLSGKWQFRAANVPDVLGRVARGFSRWMTGTVPGTIHTDLMAAGRIPDPFYRMNENEVQWVDRISWLYRRAFTVPESVLKERIIELVADGLDTFTAISINDTVVAKTENMFVAHRIRLENVLRQGENTIEILFESPTLRAQALEQEHGRLQVALQPHRVFARKAQYSFGWDWGPTLTTSGIWRPIRIEAYGARLRDPFVKVLSVSPGHCELQLEVNVEGWEAGLTFEMHIEGTGEQISVPVDREDVVSRFGLTKPRLWWPSGYGDQPIYHAQMFLRKGDEIVDVLRAPFAVRTIRLVQEPDEEGRSFIFEVNGVRIFCKGADWIPADSFLPRVTNEKYSRLLTMARDASMNMIRVWGGGIYEQDVFYDECDRLGLMVWQDFMYACAEYPDHQAFLEEAQREATAVVRRLRNHPSIALWCGNNECEWIFCSANPGKGPDNMRGAAIFRDILPAVVEKSDGTRPYWRSTPFGEGFPNAEDNGNHHQWEVWSLWKDFTHYRSDNARFVSEFGFQAPPGRKTIEGALDVKDRNPQSAAMEHHNKQVEGTERIFRFLAGHYPLSGRWDDFFTIGQLLQADALKCAVEHWRRRKFRTAGTLFWQLNDCWPVTSWSVIDSALRPKAAYYAARRFFAPVLVSFAPADDGIEVWGTNDFLMDVQGRLTLTLCTFRGKVLANKKMRVRLPANASERLFVIPRSWMQERGEYVRADLADGRRAVSVNRHFLREPKHSDFPKARIHIDLQKIARGSHRAVLKSNVLALGAALASTKEGVFFHDNFIDLDPGVPHEILITSDLSPAALRKSLSVFALNSSNGNSRGTS